MPRVEKKIVVGITGASGAVYANRLIEFLLDNVTRVYVVVTDAGQQVIRHELGFDAVSGLDSGVGSEFSLPKILSGEINQKYREHLRVCRNDDLFAPIASGSSAPDAMVVVPSSMGTLARIATGQSSNLLERAADVVLKQKKTLVMVPRETPLSSIHLRHMLSLSEMGAHIVPPMPAFYQKPKSVDDMVGFVVGRILECLSLPHDLYPAWNARMR